MIIFLAITSAIFLFDQLTKYLARQYFVEPVFLISDKVYFYLIFNGGAAFGMMQGARIFLIIITIILFCIFLYHSRKLLNSGYWMPVALLLGGGLGNFFDRIFFGVTTDFINIPYWPAFNIADSAISVGAMILIIIMLREKD